MTPLQQFIDESQAKCSVHDFQLQFDPSEEGGSGWFSYFGLLTDGGSASDVLIRRTIVRGNYDEANEKQTALAEAVADRWNALPTALQYLRELSQENELLKVHNRELRALGIERDALTRRVAELEQRIADMQDEQRNPPTLRTVCEPMLQFQRAYDTHIGPNESLIPKEQK